MSNVDQFMNLDELQILQQHPPQRRTQARPLRILISGQSEFGAKVMRLIKDRGHQTVLFVCTNKDLNSQDIAETVAAELGIPSVRAHSLDASFVGSLGALHADIGVMAYVTLKAHRMFLDLPINGTIQYHPSLLPKYRGPSAINWAIINGETTTGFTIFRPNQVLDDGYILYQVSFDIMENDSAGSLYRRALMPEGVKALIDCMEKVVRFELKGIPQDPALTTYQGWCTKNMAHINWELSARQIHNLIRGCDPQPGAWFIHNDDELVICKAVVRESYYTSEATVPSQILHIGEHSLIVKCGDGQIELFEFRNSLGARRPLSELITTDQFVIGKMLKN